MGFGFAVFRFSVDIFAFFIVTTAVSERDRYLRIKEPPASWRARKSRELSRNTQKQRENCNTATEIPKIFRLRRDKFWVPKDFLKYLRILTTPPPPRNAGDYLRALVTVNLRYLSPMAGICFRNPKFWKCDWYLRRSGPKRGPDV